MEASISSNGSTLIALILIPVIVYAALYPIYILYTWPKIRKKKLFTTIIMLLLSAINGSLSLYTKIIVSSYLALAILILHFATILLFKRCSLRDHIILSEAQCISFTIGVILFIT